MLLRVGSLGMELALSITNMQRKEVNTMKIATSFLAAMLFTAALGTLNNAIAADEDTEKVPLSADSYCHEKFPAIRGSTLGTDDPTLKDTDTGDVIDFYGPCNESPTGKDQQWEQQLEQQHRYQSGYED
jgi:hypothetical protein